MVGYKIMDKHLASLRSICETFDKNGEMTKPAYCVCGKPIEDPIHYKKEEIINKKFITNNLGLIIIKE